MANKMTYVMAIDNAIALFSQGGQIDAEDMATVERLEALKEQLAKRNSGKASNKPTKAQLKNMELADKAFDVLVGVLPEGMTPTEVGNALGVNCQKATGLLSKLVADGRVVKSTSGKRNLYKAVGDWLADAPAEG